LSDIKRLYLDIETSPDVVFSWKAGYKLNISHDSIVRERAIICVCYKWEGEDEVHSITWDKWDDKKLLERFSKIMLSADELVGHNIDKFDLRWIAGRNLINGLPPLPQQKTIDTLKIARKHFYLNSNRLDYLGHLLLGEGKRDAPYSLWKRICLHNERSAMDDMVSYCKQDVILLERIYKRLVAYETPKTHAGVLGGLDRWTCPHCASENVNLSKRRVTSKGIIQWQMKCGDCSRYYSVCNKVYRDYCVAKNGDKVDL